MPSLALVVLDGWGLAPDGPGQRGRAGRDAGLRRALGAPTRTPRSPPPGRDVGLPDGQMGNSEVGHLNLGAGAVVKQDLARIDDAIADGSFFENAALRAACGAAARVPPRAPAPDRPGLRRRRPLRLGAHRGVDRARRARRASPTWSSTPSPTAATRCRPRRRLRRGGRALAAPGRAGSARSAAATRRWTATGAGTGPSAPTTRSSTREGPSGGEPRSAAIATSYERDETDEFIEPTVIGDYDGAEPTATPFVFINFRPDRARQLTRALGEPDFDEFDRGGGRPLRADDDDRVPRRLALPGRLPAARARRPPSPR